MAQNQKKHPLEFSDLKNHAIPFTQIEPEMFLPRLREAIDQAKHCLDGIKSQKAPSTFENTILALETLGEDIDIVSAVFFNQLNANTNEKMQALAREVSPLLSNYSSDIQLDHALFLRVQEVYNQSQSSPQSLSEEQKELLEKYYSGFVRNGAKLNTQQKEELRSIDSELSQLGPQFAENVLKATNDFQLILTQKEELEGLPPSALESAQLAAEEKGLKDSWLFTLQAPSYLAFMQFGAHRPSREKLYRAYNRRAFGGPYDNSNTLMRILELREKRARLLGYKNHAEFTLEKRMAEKPEKVFSFLNRLREASFEAAKRDVEKVVAFAQKSQSDLDSLMPWDFTYWAERLKENLFRFSDEDLRPYFQLENVMTGAFEHARRLYGLEFRESQEYPVYHPDVRVYEVHEEGQKKFVGLFYADFFPRESKNGGAWMTNYFEQGHLFGEVRRPHVAIVCNFTKPTKDKPSLLTFGEVQTLFHEFGHSLHSLLSQCHYRSLSGTNVYWDFVELPSQIMENWILEKESLDLFARHYKTGELLPEDLAKKIKDSSLYLAGYNSLRQVTFALLDMAWHTTEFRNVGNPAEFEKKIIDPLRVLPQVDGTNFSCAFSHIFAGGYSAGYYSYKWAEVLDADAFELFKEKGLFDKATAEKFKENILSRGGTTHPMNLYKKFRGREPNPDALLRRDGLI